MRRFVALRALLLLAALLSLPAGASDVQNLTPRQAFDAAVAERNDVWIVAFSNLANPGSAFSQAAPKLKNILRLGYVDCSGISVSNEKDEHASANCAKFAKAAKESKEAAKTPLIFGYTFSAKGDFARWDKQYFGRMATDKIVKWALGLAPKLALQLTAHAGTNVLHKEELSAFLQRPRMAKALVFTTSPKGDPPSLVTALAVRFRQRMLIGEVKASDMALRNSFSVKAPPALVVIDRDGKRHVYSGSEFKRPAIEKFLSAFAASSPDPSIHAGNGEVKMEKVKVKKQQYSDAEKQQYPKGFNPWSVLSLSPSKSVPAADVVKTAYKKAAIRWHPDKCKEKKDTCEGRMAAVALAKMALSSNRELQVWEAWRMDSAKRRSRSDL